MTHAEAERDVRSRPLRTAAQLAELADFYRDFTRNLASQEQPDPRYRSQRFAVHRNNAARGAVEALRASYPTVDSLLGADMFTAVARDYRRETSPTSPILSEYGADFSAFIARQPWICDLPYVADVAQLDRLWLESFLAGGVSRTKPERSASRIVLHPAARFAWLETPALTIWQAHRDPHGIVEFEPEWREEGALFTRPVLAVCAEPIEPVCHRLLDLCSAPIDLGECLSAVAADFPGADVPALLQRCVARGAVIFH